MVASVDRTELVNGAFYTVRSVVDLTAGTWTLYLNGVEEAVVSTPLLTSFDVTKVYIGAKSDFALKYKGAITGANIGSGELLWDGTIVDATAQGWVVEGNPATVAQKRTMPPQVLGLDFNQFVNFDGSNDQVGSSTIIPDYANSTITMTLLYTEGEQQIIELKNNSAYSLAATINSTLNANHDLVIASDNSSNCEAGTIGDTMA